MKIEFPEATPDFVIAAVTNIHERADSMLRSSSVTADYARGYYAAAADVVGTMETEAAIERGDREEKIREARENAEHTQ
jgi:hypothetical protein